VGRGREVSSIIWFAEGGVGVFLRIKGFGDNLRRDVGE